jgi:SAM-dependent methyltransferase
LDFSEAMLDSAKLNLGDKATCVQGDATDLSMFEDASFDRYLSNLGCCCTSDLSSKLSEARRVLAPGGIAAMSMRIEGGEGDTSAALIQSTLSEFGLGDGPDREGLRIGRDLPALRQRVADAGFSGGAAVAWRTFATLPIHDVESFISYAYGSPPIKLFLDGLDEPKRAAADRALREAAAAQLECGAIQVAVAVVVARC